MFNYPLMRGCGVRVPGGIYATLPTGPGGRPVEDYLWCPPKEVDVDAIGLSDIGVRLITDAKGVTHIIDRVGFSYYPNVSDFVEETRRLGLSRKLNDKLIFAALEPGSRILLVHDRAILANADDYNLAEPDLPNVLPWRACPRKREDHDRAHALGMCARLYWQDIRGGEELIEGRRDVRREIPCDAYEGFRKPDGVRPKYRPAIFASFPIRRLEIIRDEDGGTHETAAAKAGASKLDISFEDA